jgi:manganese/zinc/iron transport system substrate-binding protein
MNSKILTLFSFLILLNFFSCSKRTNDLQDWMNDDRKIKILSTTQMISDIVKQVGGTHISALALIKGELDPHSYQLVKGDDEKLAYADLIFYNGLGLEHGPSLQHHLQGNPKAIPVGDKIFQDNPSLIIHVNGKLDPHIWMDISLWAKTVPYILEALIKKDPTNTEEYRSNAKALLAQMAAVHQEAKETFNHISSEKRYLVTSHDAFNYFTRAYLATEEEVKEDRWQMRFAAPEGLAPESQLSTTDIKNIIAHVAKYHIDIIFPETNVSRDSIKKIVQAGNEQGLHLKIACCPLYGDAMGPPGSAGDTYLKMIKYDAKTIAEKLTEH